MRKQIEGQLKIFDFLQREDFPKKEVKLVDACEFKKGELHEYTVSTTYSDVVLLISMLHEYIEMLKEVDGSRMEYYRNKFEEMAKHLEESIGYNYQEKLEKCRRKNTDKDDRLGENWIGA